MLDDFFVRALLAGIRVALVAGPLGCIVVWRRMAYFGDTMAHSALLGVALGYLMDVASTIGVIDVTAAIALALLTLQSRREMASDTILGVLSHASLSIGLVVISLMVWLRLDLVGDLFGDVLAVSVSDLIRIYGGGRMPRTLCVADVRHAIRAVDRRGGASPVSGIAHPPGGSGVIRSTSGAAFAAIFAAVFDAG